MSRLFRGLVAAALLAAAGCATEQGSSGGSGPAGSAPSLSISAPGSGGTVAAPFVVQLNSSVPIGPPESGNHHVHIFFDGDDSEYTLAYSTNAEVSTLPADLAPGRHVLNASLRNPDHSAAGVETQIDVTLGAGGPTGGTDADSDDGYGY